jgi:hypothetical protein
MKESTVTTTEVKRIIILDNDEIASILRDHFKLHKSTDVKFDVASDGHFDGASLIEITRSVG